MKKSVNHFILGLALITGFFSPPAFAAPEGQVVFDLKNKESIVFSPQELRYLRPLLNLNGTPQYHYATRILEQAPESLKSKLLQLAHNQFAVISKSNDSLSAYSGYSPQQLLELSNLFYSSVIEAIIKHLHQNSKAQIRFLSRDSDELYARLLSSINSRQDLSPDQKISFIERTGLVSLSRDIAAKLNEGKSVDELLRVLQLDVATVKKSSSIDLIDIGYFGTLIDKDHIGPVLDSSKILKDKVRLFLAFKAPGAHDKALSLDLVGFYKTVAENHPEFKSEDAMASPQSVSFRVQAIEHQPKWFSRLLAPPSKTVHIMMDIDDMLLKEVGYKESLGHPQVQYLSYKPSARYLKKYSERLKANGSKPVEEKVIHYEFSNATTIKSSIVVRPSAMLFLERIQPLIEGGIVKLHLTSNNDAARTAAVFEQVKINGKTLKSMGARVAEKREFQSDGHLKDPSLFRHTHNIDADSAIIAVDDSPQLYTNVGANDFLFPVQEWNHQLANEYMNSDLKFKNWSVSDHLYFQWIAQQVYLSTFALTRSKVEDRILTLAKSLVETDERSHLSSINTNGKVRELLESKNSNDIFTALDRLTDEKSLTDLLAIPNGVESLRADLELLGERFSFRLLNWALSVNAAHKSHDSAVLLERILLPTSPSMLEAVKSLSRDKKMTVFLKQGHSRILEQPAYGNAIYQALSNGNFQSEENWFINLREKYELPGARAKRLEGDKIMNEALGPYKHVDAKLVGLLRDFDPTDICEYLDTNLKIINRDQEFRDEKGHHTLSDNGKIFNGWLLELKKTEDKDVLAVTMIQMLKKFYADNRFTHFDVLVLSGFIFDLASPSKHLFNEVMAFKRENLVFRKILDQEDYYTRQTRSGVYTWIKSTIASIETHESSICEKTLEALGS